MQLATTVPRATYLSILCSCLQRWRAGLSAIFDTVFHHKFLSKIVIPKIANTTPSWQEHFTTYFAAREC